MGFWDTFLKVWQVRTSVKIQESLENSFRVATENSKFQANFPDIIQELDKKNKFWDDKINHHRNKNKNMNGLDFYAFLRTNFNQNGQPLYGNFTFCDWLYKQQNNTFSFRFNIINNNPKSIPQNIIIAAWDANHVIDDDWIENNFGIRFSNDCRLHVLNFLLNNYNHLR